MVVLHYAPHFFLLPRSLVHCHLTSLLLFLVFSFLVPGFHRILLSSQLAEAFSFYFLLLHFYHHMGTCVLPFYTRGGGRGNISR